MVSNNRKTGAAHLSKTNNQPVNHKNHRKKGTEDVQEETEIKQKDPQDKAARWKKYIEYISVGLIGVATIFGALAAYYSTIWSGESISKYNSGIMTMSDSNTGYLEYLNEYTTSELTAFKDDVLYLEWKKLYDIGDPDAEYVFSRLSEGLQEDLTLSLESGDSDTGSFESSEAAEWEAKYAQMDEMFAYSQEQFGQATELMEKGEMYNQYGDSFTFSTVLFTIVLFFAGLSSTANRIQIKGIYISCAFVLFVYAIIKMFMIPLP